MNITDEMLEAFAADWSAHDCGPGDCCTRAGLERVAPLIAAQALREERTEWGVRWHGADVIHGRGGDGQDVHDEQSARAVAEKYASAEAVHRRAAGPWTDAP
jgi:hypothetical protein